jgi:hypothetical protein
VIEKQRVKNGLRFPRDEYWPIAGIPMPMPRPAPIYGRRKQAQNVPMWVIGVDPMGVKPK